MTHENQWELIDAMLCGAIIVGAVPAAAEPRILYVNTAFCGTSDWFPRDIVGAGPQTVWSGGFKFSDLAGSADTAWTGPILTHHADQTATTALWQIGRFDNPSSDGPSFLCVQTASLSRSDFSIGLSDSQGVIGFKGKQCRRSDIVPGKIMRAAADAIIVIDESLEVIEFNRDAESMFGFDRRDIVGKPIDILLPERLHRAHRRYIRNVGVNKPAARLLNERVENVGRRRNGEEFPCHASIIRIDDGDRILYATILSDRTDSKKLEFELQDARDRAEQGNEAKSRFLATVSHELRTPLNAIIGFSALLQAEIHGPLVNPKYRDYVEDINASGHHLLGIINGIMEISRIDNGQIDRSPDEFRLTAAISETVKMAGALAREKSLVLNVDVPNNIVVRASKEILCQILMQLVGNSIKFSDEPGNIDISAWIEPDAALCLAVSDHGIGIPENQLNEVTKPFFQVDSSDTRQYQGIGLGLSLVQRFVELHGGTFRIANNPGRGTTATVKLPPSCIAEAPFDDAMEPTPLSARA